LKEVESKSVTPKLSQEEKLRQWAETFIGKRMSPHPPGDTTEGTVEWYHLGQKREWGLV